MTATCAIIPASGLGKRLSSACDGKAFVTIAGQPLIAHTLTAFQTHRDIDDIVIIARKDDMEALQELTNACGFTKVRVIVPGGELRQDSVRNGLAAVSCNTDVVAIHDGARPLVTHDVITRCLEAARENGAAIAAVPVIDTIKESHDRRFVDGTPDRQNLFAVQTPQTFTLELIRSAYEKAYADKFTGTDDASLVERLGIPVRLVTGSYENFKVTTPSDISFAEAIMMQRVDRDASCLRRTTRIGHGYDIHRFAEGRELHLGGVYFPGEEGLLGHSDADVLLHAVADALLGAAAAGDIGKHFPDTDPAYKNADSIKLLAHVGRLLDTLAWQVVNLDVTLIAQRPRISAYVPQMCANISEALGISEGQVSVKATTAEGLGAIGEGLGIECHAVALIEAV